MLSKCFPLIFVFISGCASVTGYNFEPDNIADAESYVIYTEDEFEEKSWLETKPTVNLSYGNAIYNLRALFESDSKTPSFIQVYVNLRLFDWYFINDAVMKNHNVTLTPIDRVVMSGSAVHEDVALNISLETLKAMSEEQIKIKLKGKRGDYVFIVNPVIAKAFLNELGSINNS